MQMDRTRRLNFLVGEDFYFLAYSIINALHAFSGSGEPGFKDHRKLAHLVQLMSDQRLIGILERHANRKIVNPVDHELLFSSFTRGELHKHEVFKLLIALQKRGYVELGKANRTGVFDVTLNRSKLPENFLATEIFSEEQESAVKLKRLVPRLGAMTQETFMERIYTSKGLQAWAA